MKTFLRNTLTGQYFQGVADWTERLHLAFDFQTPERLVRFVRAAGLNPEHFELVFSFPNSSYNLSLPVDERFGICPTKRPMTSPAVPGCSPQKALGAGRRSRPVCRTWVQESPQPRP